ncbi:MAG: NADH-quinone oxidoreductase subunit NuoK [Pseudomonadota bacterium]|uniref:NADH-quinone oxidoreductase subunit K n=1 Tax=Candidatus Desulfatibia profunda TaxID=2841695 RepID=A0A8J6NTF8_9BACT|nr:NADH-quinone oxidoreductase subunit NuoK [Candidatus Desulfatibia profunda]MBL7180402.1 NADH-quinone oxidoreductase subunit NuoK [Desulfobacterales bacterium]MBU0698383.1 NADH-quinone oxidoreductase subunit NuoK [Pseudomonadota bacterium]
MIVPYSHVLVLAGILFLMGMFCAVTRRNLIMILLGLEIMLNAAVVAFVGAALRWQHLEGQAVAIFVLAIAAAEVSIGLALVVRVYKQTGSIDPGAYN